MSAGMNEPSDRLSKGRQSDGSTPFTGAEGVLDSKACIAEHMRSPERQGWQP